MAETGCGDCEKSTEATFSLTGEDIADNIEGVEVIKYWGRLLDCLDDNWTTVLRNIRKARHVWGCLGKFLLIEGAYPFILEKFYHAMVQAVLLFGAETWVLFATMSK